MLLISHKLNSLFSRYPALLPYQSVAELSKLEEAFLDYQLMEKNIFRQKFPSVYGNLP